MANKKYFNVNKILVQVITSSFEKDYVKSLGFPLSLCFPDWPSQQQNKNPEGTKEDKTKACYGLGQHKAHLEAGEPGPGMARLLWFDGGSCLYIKVANIPLSGAALHQT